MHSFANMYGAFDVVLYFVIIQLFWLLINLLLILSYLILVNSDFLNLFLLCKTPKGILNLESHGLFNTTRPTQCLQATRSAGSLHISFKLTTVCFFTSSNHCLAALPRDIFPSTFNVSIISSTYVICSS